MPERVRNDGPVYVAIADALEVDITNGRLRSGDRLPTHRELARRLEVNVMTVTRAYAEAARRGLVEGEVGRGTFVRDRGPVGPVPTLPPSDESVIDFSFNLPVGDPAILDFPGALGAVAKELDPNVMLNGYLVAGLPAHRAAGAEMLRASGLADADAERTLVCGGAQHAMSVALSTLASPGDVVLTEELTYPGMKSLANVLHLRLHGVAIDELGLIPDALDEACKKTHAKVLYCMPTLHNPTAVVMPEDRRRAVADVAARHGMAIVEDDSTGFLCPDAPPPIASFAPDLGYFLTSTSKSIASGLRIGFLHAPPGARAMVDRLAASIAGLTWMASPLTAELAARWIRNGTSERMIAWKRREASARFALFRDLLPGLDVPSHESSGHLWLPLPPPWRADDFVADAHLRGVAVTPSDIFVAGRAGAPHAVRIGIATPPSRAEAEKGMRVLAEMIGGPPGCCRPIV